MSKPTVKCQKCKGDVSPVLSDCACGASVVTFTAYAESDSAPIEWDYGEWVVRPASASKRQSVTSDEAISEAFDKLAERGRVSVTLTKRGDGFACAAHVYRDGGGYSSYVYAGETPTASLLAWANDERRLGSRQSDPDEGAPI